MQIYLPKLNILRIKESADTNISYNGQGYNKENGD